MLNIIILGAILVIVIMLSVIMLNIIMLGDILVIVIIPSVIMLIVIMLSVYILGDIMSQSVVRSKVSFYKNL